jgi:glycosyltransferase involved in cell wall biosynthesis
MPLRITYLLESTALWGGNKVAMEQAVALADEGHIVNLISKDEGPDWYRIKLPVRKADAFDRETIPESDIIVATFWPTVKPACESGRGAVVHLCQGYEGSMKELSAIKDKIDEAYSINIPRLTVSPHLDILLKEKFNAETYYIGQMLNREILHPEKNPLRSVVKHIRRRKKLLVVGPFEASVKNIPLALRAISLARKRAHILFTRVSQFQLSRQEEEILRPDFYYFHVPYEKMGDIYRDSDILISLSSPDEGFGLPALEAMACGVPAILSRIPSYMSLDEPLDYALFADFGAETVSDAIVKLCADAVCRRRLSVRGLEVADKFTKEAVLSRLKAAFEDILSKGKR